jgi:hypothetical protein
MKDQSQFHSRLDFSQAPAPTGWWARVLGQIQLQLLLTFYPHPDTPFYPTRLRVLLAAILVLFGTAFLGYYWWDVKRDIPHYGKLLAAMLSLSVLAIVQVLWQPIPRLKNHIFFPVFLWFCLPVFFFLDYLMMAGRSLALEYLCVMLLLYSNLLHWRVAALGMATALAFSAVVAYWLQGRFFYPAPLDIFGLFIVPVVGLVSSYTFGRVDSQRYAQNARAVRTVGSSLETAFGVQLALSEALRHEVQRSNDANTQRRLAEVVQKLDLRANLTRAQLQEIEKEVGQMQVLDVRLLQVERLCPAVVQELESAYGWPDERLQNCLQCDEQAGLVLQGVWVETVQLLASVLALMLRQEAGRGVKVQDAEDPNRLALQWDQTQGWVRLSVGRVADMATFAVLDAQQSKHSAAEHLALAERLLPAYSIYVMKKMGAQLQLHTTAAGQVDRLRLSWPRPDLLQNRFTGYRPLSLLQMYEDHAL